MFRVPTLVALLSLLPVWHPAQPGLPIDPNKLVPGRDSFAIRIQGVELGYTVSTTERTPEGIRFIERSNIGGLVEEQTTIDLDQRAGMKGVRQSGKVQGEPTSIELTYADGRVRGVARTVGPDGPKSATVDTLADAGVIDDNAVPGLLKALPWAPGARWSFAVFSGAQNESRLTELAVAATDSMVRPGGTLPVYRVEWTGGWQPTTFWITTTAPHRVIRIMIANAPVEIVRVN
ncbi:MAG: hypothetical protein AB7L66_06245 [Gemmatimonadales bacterium]